MPPVSRARLLHRRPPGPWTLVPEGDSYLLHLRNYWPAYEVVVDHADGGAKTLPLLRLSEVPALTALRVPALPPANAGGPWLRVSWREAPRGGPRRSQRTKSALLSAHPAVS